jgi:hypothetical protein
MENEEFLDKPPKGISSNYEVYEDKLICMAWKMIGLDAAIDTEKPGNAYWNRMTDYFNANTNGNRRSMDYITLVQTAGVFMSGDMGTSMGGGIPLMAGGMGGVISYNTSNVGDDANGEYTPQEYGYNGRIGTNGEATLIEP